MHQGIVNRFLGDQIELCGDAPVVDRDTGAAIESAVDAIALLGAAGKVGQRVR